MTIVVDASALVAIGFVEPGGDELRPLIRDHDLHAPRLFPEEVANATRKKVREDPANADELLRQWRNLRAVKVELHELDLEAVLSLAIDTGLMVYDASYLWLAEQLDCLVATRDKHLIRVARQRNRLAEP